MYYTTWIMGVKRMQPGCDTEGMRPFVIWIHPLYCYKSNFGTPFLKKYGKVCILKNKW